MTDGGVAFDPDEQVRFTIQLIFRKFTELGSGHAVYRYLLKHDIRLGMRPIEGPYRGHIEWRRSTSATVFSILKHPMYAGAYAYGRCATVPKRRHTHKTDRKWVSPEEWKVLLCDRVPAYISWDQYLSNQQRLKHNRASMIGRSSQVRIGALRIRDVLQPVGVSTAVRIRLPISPDAVPEFSSTTDLTGRS
jgi:Recombinase